MSVWPLWLASALYFAQAVAAGQVGAWATTVAFVCYAVANVALAFALK